MKKINFKKGAAEFISFAVTAPFICIIVIMMCAYISMSSAVHSIRNATEVAGRSAALCSNYNDACIQSQRVAENAITSKKIENIEVTIEYANEADQAWHKGNYIIVNVSANIDTIMPYVTNGKRTVSTIVCIENE